MARFGDLPNEILQNVIRYLIDSQKPFKTEFLLLNKTLYDIIMCEQVREINCNIIYHRKFIKMNTNNSYLKLRCKYYMDKIYAIYVNHSALSLPFTPEIVTLEEITTFISRCRNLRSITLNTDIYYGSYIIANGLKQNLTLTVLSFSHTTVGSDLFTPISALTNYLKQNRNLTHLYFKGIINQKGACDLAYCLTLNSDLIKLALELEYIENSGFEVLMNSLKQSTKLANLILKWPRIHGICDRGVYPLADCLTNMSTLSTLHLGGNNIGDEGVYALVNSLKQGPMLVELNLRQNQISDKGARILADYLKYNLFLTFLNLYLNKIADQGAYALMNSLKQNSTITKLNLYLNEISPEAKKVLQMQEPRIVLT